MTVFINKECSPWEPINNSQYNVMIIKNAWKPQLASEKKIHSFDMKWNRNKLNYFKTNLHFCPRLENFMGRMATNFAMVADSDEYFLKLEHITTNSCKAFHDDKLSKRLICTIFGPGGTQWADINNINYSHLNGHFHSADEKNLKLIKDFTKIHTADVGDILLMKGAKSNAKYSFVHRSYPLSSNEDRWVFTISEKFN